MNTKKKGEINRYMRKVRHLLPTMHKAERRFITNLRQDIEELAQTRPSISYEALVTEFGDPHELVNNYISEKDIDTIRKELHISHYIKSLVITGILAILLVTGFKMLLAHLDYLHAQESQIAYDTTVIEELETSSAEEALEPSDIYDDTTANEEEH
ncbi:hypothetical protein G4313_06190 [Coprococcus eutactus]|nr:hypothetical protein [Coprococcus eutactus]CCY60373.1 uncharacterized protein BN572_00247 [Clostridium sp. CAG:264]